MTINTGAVELSLTDISSIVSNAAAKNAWDYSMDSSLVINALRNKHKTSLPYGLSQSPTVLASPRSITMPTYNLLIKGTVKWILWMSLIGISASEIKSDYFIVVNESRLNVSRYVKQEKSIDTLTKCALSCVQNEYCQSSEWNSTGQTCFHSAVGQTLEQADEYLVPKVQRSDVLIRKKSALLPGMWINDTIIARIQCQLTWSLDEQPIGYFMATPTLTSLMQSFSYIQNLKSREELLCYAFSIHPISYLVVFPTV